LCGGIKYCYTDIVNTNNNDLWNMF
jgi:hypothetical protein